MPLGGRIALAFCACVQSALHLAPFYLFSDQNYNIFIISGIAALHLLMALAQRKIIGLLVSNLTKNLHQLIISSYLKSKVPFQDRN